MATQNALQIWQDRWLSLDDTLEDAISSYDLLAQNDSRIKTLQCLIKRLRAFTEGQVKFFLDGFNDSITVPYDLVESLDEYPFQHVFDATLRQAAYDLAVIRQAVDQRDPLGEMRASLDIADRLAWEALQAAVGPSKLLQDVDSVVTYFAKTPLIRVIPYAKVALIGIPLTAKDISRDYLSIPHEIGHYVFWRGQVNPGARYLREYLREVVPDNLTWRYRWIEEIFADVYGCMIGGPAIALSSQDLSYIQAWVKYIEEDEKHPVAILRPHIYTKVLVARAYGAPILAEELDEKWINERERGRVQPNFIISSGHQRVIDEAIGFQGASPPYDYTVLDSNKPVDEVITEILNLTEVTAITPGQWSNYLVGENYQTLYQQFEDYLTNSTLPDPPPNLVDCITEGIWESWLEENFAAVFAEQNTQNEISVEDWLPVLRAYGWVTRVAHANWP